MLPVTDPNPRYVSHTASAESRFDVPFLVFANNNAEGKGELSVALDGAAYTTFTVEADWVDGVGYNAVVVTTAPVTGNLEIVGVREPRRSAVFNRLHPFSEQFVTALNRELNILQAQDAEATRTFGEIAANRPFDSITDFGGRVDIADNAAAITAAEAGADTIFVPEGFFPSSKANFTSFSKKLFGFGQLGTVAGKMAPFYSRVNGPIASHGNHSSLLTAFDGDLSGQIFSVGQSLAGACLGVPTTGYSVVPETSLEYHNVYVAPDVGHNENTVTNEGRTQYVKSMTRITFLGQGDATAYHADVFVGSANPDATHFLASPAGSLFSGTVFGGVDYTNVTLGELALDDQGHDCRGTGFVINYDRAFSGTPLHSNFWNGIRLQSRKQYCESAYQVAAYWKIGLDLTPAEISQAAIAMVQNQKIEFHASSTADAAGIKRYADTLNGWTLQYNATLAGFLFSGNGNKILSLTTGASAVNYMDITAAATGLPVQIDFLGTDTNVAALYRTQGTGAHTFRTSGVAGAGGTTQFTISATPNAVNYINATGAVTGSPPVLSATGSDTNIAIRLAPKGTSAVAITLANIQDCVDDAAAATAGVIVGGLYRTGTDVKVRIA